jgi:hypothetical protein
MRCVADDEPNPLPNGYRLAYPQRRSRLSPLNIKSNWITLFRNKIQIYRFRSVQPEFFK